MLKYLLKSAYETYKSDGILVLFEQIARYFILYGNPVNIADYWYKRLSGKRWQKVKVQGSFMLLDLKDKGIHADLYINRIREPQATRYLQSIMKPDWTVADIGANIGYYALQEASKVKEVIAIEPSPDNYKNLVHNISLNHYKNIETHQLAIGDHDGEIGFEIAAACNWNKIARDGKGNINVKLTTLDKFLNGRKVDFIRMDVEGYELSILKGMDNTLKTYRPAMFIEVHRDLLKDYGSSQLEFMEYLAKYDYAIDKAFISAREGCQGKIRNLLAIPKYRQTITERGIASHIFFKG